MFSVSQFPDGDPSRRVRRCSRVRVVRACRVAFLMVTVVFALVGALTTPPYVLLVAAPAVGAFFGGVVALSHPAFPEAPSARRAVAFSGMGAALFALTLAGLGQFGSAGMIAAVVLVVLGCIAVGGWIVEHADAPDRGPASDLDMEGLQQFVQVLPTSMLLREWRSTAEHVQAGADPHRRAEAVLVRNLLLEELSRRDPVGVARWLSEGDEDAPEQYLRGDSDATT
jgi:MFS family permease